MNIIVRTGSLTFFIFAALVSCDLSNVDCADVVKSFPGFECAPDGLLGKGAFGVAFLVRDSTHDAVLKVTEFNSQTSDREVGMLKKFDHPNVLKIFASATQGSHHLLLTEYGANKDLQSYMEAHPDAFPLVKDKLELIIKIAAGLQHIHDAGFVHGDIKPANVVLDNNLNPKIIDFNLATQINTKDVFKGTYEYAAPKLLRFPDDPNHKYLYGPSDDVYSLGVLIFWLFNDGHVPFEAKDAQGLNARHRAGIYEIKAGTPVGVAQAIHVCLRRPHHERATLTQVATFLSQIRQELEVATLTNSMKLDINSPFPNNFWNSNGRYMGFWNEFSEMFFLFSLVMVMIPLTVYCLKMKFEAPTAQRPPVNQPLQPAVAPEHVPADGIAVVE